MLTIFDIQKMRYDNGSVVYNTNNNRFAIVLNGKAGSDSDPCSVVLEQDMDSGFMVHTPPNRALIPVGRHIDLNDLMRHMTGKLVGKEG